MFLQHLEHKDFKSNLILMHFCWRGEKKHLGGVKVKILQITCGFLFLFLTQVNLSLHLKAVVFHMSQMTFHTQLLQQLLKAD